MYPRLLTRDTNVAQWPYYAEDELEAVQDVLRSGLVNYWTGENGRAFEQEYARYFGCQYAVALANGTLALDLALGLLGIGAGDEVIVTPRTFIASGSTAILRGATPIFCDVDCDSGNITAATIAPVITPRTKAINVVHLGGWPCEMDAILRLAAAHGLAVIEDCAQSHGARYKGRYAGSFGDVSAWSFCQDKIISTGGEGGMLLTNRLALWKNAWAYKDHGKSWDAVYHRQHAPGFRWLHEDFGTNLRMTEMQAALGRKQLQKLANWVEIRQRNAKILFDALSPLHVLRIPTPGPECEHAYYRFYAYVRPEALKTGWNRTRILEEITAQGIFCNAGSCGEIYREQAFVKFGLTPARRLPVARELGETSLALRVHPTLSINEMAETADVVAEVIREATR